MPHPVKQFFYSKRCRICNQVYFKNLITREQFDNLADNPHITFHHGQLESFAEISSVCEKDVEKAYG